MSMWIFLELGAKASNRHGPVGFVGAVHAEHAEPLLVGRGIGAQAHQRRRDREARKAHELAQQLAGLGAGIDDAAAGVENGTLGVGQQFHRLAHGRLLRLQLGTVGLVGDVRRADVVAGRELDVLRDIDDHGAGTARARDMERLVQHARQVVHVLHQPVVLGAGTRDADGIAFLERVVADQVRRHLAGDADQRNGIHQGVGQAGNGVRRARAGSDEDDADLAGGARIALGCMHRAAFLADENVADLVLLEQLVIDRQHGAAGIAEEHFHTLIAERLDHHLGARHRACHRIVPVSVSR